MTVGTKVSGYMSKFSHWRSHGKEEAMQQAKDESRLLNVHNPCGTNRSSYEAYPSIYSTYQSYVAKWKVILLTTHMCPQSWDYIHTAHGITHYNIGMGETLLQQKWAAAFRVYGPADLVWTGSVLHQTTMPLVGWHWTLVVSCSWSMTGREARKILKRQIWSNLDY